MGDLLWKAADLSHVLCAEEDAAWRKNAFAIEEPLDQTVSFLDIC